MKLPKQSAGVGRAGVSRAADVSGVLPSSFISRIKKELGNAGGAISEVARQPACRTACRSAQAAAIVACAAYSGPALAACEAAAIVGGNECYNAC